jgi:AAA+ ATPase superfamily predicted ATPase
MSFMENQILGYKSPLYGRRSCQFKIEPFNYYECAQMLPGFSHIDKITLFGICGGIPEYITRINTNLSVQQNAQMLFFNPSGRLFDEPSNLLKQELKAPQTYNGIITAIASGASKVNEIASTAGIETSQCSAMLSTLISLGIVKKEYPLSYNTREKPSRKTIYRLADFMFRFWHCFVRPDLSRISMGMGKTVCAEVFEKSGGKIETYMGPVFEECAAQFLWQETGKGRYGCKSIGRWWGPNPKEKKEEEIDIIAADEKGNALFGECKWRNSRTGNEVLANLVRKSELVPHYAKKRYILFSKSDFTSQLKKTSVMRKDTTLVTVKEML